MANLRHLASAWGHEFAPLRPQGVAIISIDRHAYLAAYNSRILLHVSEPAMDYLGLWHRAGTAGDYSTEQGARGLLPDH